MKSKSLQHEKFRVTQALETGETDLIIVWQTRLGRNERQLSLGKLEYKLYVPLTWPNLVKYQKRTIRNNLQRTLRYSLGNGEKRRTFVEQTTISKIGKKPNYELECSSFIEILEAVKSNCFCGIPSKFLQKTYH